jgi:hypothetical protein
MKLIYLSIITFLILFLSCNSLTMKDVYEDENLPMMINGTVENIEIYKVGNITLKVMSKSGKSNHIAVDTILKSIVRKNDYFEKKANSNKCLIRRNDSIIFIDCFDIPKEIRDSLKTIEEWPKNLKGKWQNVK